MGVKEKSQIINSTSRIYYLALRLYCYDTLFFTLFTISWEIYQYCVVSNNKHLMISAFRTSIPFVSVFQYTTPIDIIYSKNNFCNIFNFLQCMIHKKRSHRTNTMTSLSFTGYLQFQNLNQIP